MGRIWDDVITEQDRRIYQASGMGQERVGFGRKPALLIIDITYNFVGDKPEPVLESIQRFPTSCGEVGWVALRKIAGLLPLVREKGIPVIYSIPDPGPRPPGWIPTKGIRRKEAAAQPTGHHIVKEIAPAPGDIVIAKPRASIFYGTPLLSYLQSGGVDTLLVTGCVTSGCVRAAVVDGLSNNYRTTVIEECVFDRGEVSHKVSLFDMNQKYADVLPLAEVEEYLRGLKPL